jgi:hypothetical protein
MPKQLIPIIHIAVYSAKVLTESFTLGLCSLSNEVQSTKKLVFIYLINQPLHREFLSMMSNMKYAKITPLANQSKTHGLLEKILCGASEVIW